MKALIIGDEGATHAVAWKLAQSPAATTIFSAPGNYGTNLIGANLAISPTDPEALAAWAKEQEISLTAVVSPLAMAYGVVDAFRARGLRAFGPTRAAARLVTSRAWAKGLLARHGIATAPAYLFASPEEAALYVEGLRPEAFPLLLTPEEPIGSGRTRLAGDQSSALFILGMLSAQRGPTTRMLVESYRPGPSVSLLVVADGVTTLPIGVAHVERRAYDGEQGPLTEGMGAYAPVPGLDPGFAARALDRVVRPLLAAMDAEDAPFSGILSLDLDPDSLEVLSIGPGLGDLAAQVLLPLWEDDLYIAMDAAIDRELAALRPFRFSQSSACAVVAASEGYPGESETGYGILGLGEVGSGAQVFHIGSRNPYRRETELLIPKQERDARSGLARGFSSWIMPSRGRSKQVDSQASRAGGDPYSRVVTGGGRVLAVVGKGRTPAEARATAYRGIEAISFTGAWARRDIGAAPTE